MRFLTQYSPVTPLSGPPSAEMQAKMGAFMKESVEAGVLIATGMVMSSAVERLVCRRGGDFFASPSGRMGDSQRRFAGSPQDGHAPIS
jgi:hypothetical protein